MELVDVDVIGPESGQRGVKVLPEFLRGGGHGLGGQENLLPLAFKGPAQLFLAVRVGTGSIIESEAPLQSPVEDGDGGIHVGPLDGQGAKGVLRGGDAGGAKGDSFHGVTLLLFD